MACTLIRSSYPGHPLCYSLTKVFPHCFEEMVKNHLIKHATNMVLAHPDVITDGVAWVGGTINHLISYLDLDGYKAAIIGDLPAFLAGEIDESSLQTLTLVMMTESHLPQSEYLARDADLVWYKFPVLCQRTVSILNMGKVGNTHNEWSERIEHYMLTYDFYRGKVKFIIISRFPYVSRWENKPRQ